MTGRNFADWVKGISAEEKEQLIRKIEESAYQCERTYYGCARCVLKALMQHLNLGNLEDGQLMKASFPFAGGVGRTDQICGTLSGGVMAIGLAYSSDKFEPPFSPTGEYTYGDESMDRVNNLCARFEKEFGGLTCPDVQRYIHGRVWKLSNPKENEEFRQPEIHNKCANAARKTARLAAEVILGPVERVISTESK